MEAPRLQHTPPAGPAERGRQESAFEVALPLTGIAPGAAAIEVTARLPDGRVMTRVVPIQVFSAPER
jgi:hypothetical protein